MTKLFQPGLGPITRRQMLRRTSAGFGSLALSAILAEQAQGAPISVQNLSVRAPHFAPRAKRVIFLMMHGGPSAVDTFDYKPRLAKDNGKEMPVPKPRVTFTDNATHNLMVSPWKFKQYGQCGAWCSELFPNVAKRVDDLTFIKSLHGSNVAHGGAMLKMHTGTDTFVWPSMGAWISYGLGTENQNLPSFITIDPTMGHGGANNFGAAFLPAMHQGTRIGKGMTDSIGYLKPGGSSLATQRRRLDLMAQMNREHLARTGGVDSELEGRIESFELAFRMQTEAPQVMDFSKESDAIKQLYGLDEDRTESFGRQCLLARRFAEAGVRFIQCSHHYWDQHENLTKKHAKLAAQVDQPIAGLLTDLKQRGLLDDTLVIWGGEFGRTPTAEKKDGRDHNPYGFTWWMAGAGLKPGFSYGATDEFGYYAERDKVHVHDLHATILYLLGLDHERLTYRHAGRDFRLTDVHGHVVHELFA